MLKGKEEATKGGVCVGSLHANISTTCELFFKKTGYRCIVRIIIYSNCLSCVGAIFCNRCI